MTVAMPLIDIRPDHWAIVQDILQKYVPQYTVWAFGSRAKWSAKEYSDLDLAVITDRPLSLDVSASLSDDFSESDLPYKVDVVDWATTSESFRKIIERDKVVVQETETKGGEMGNVQTLNSICSLIVDCPHSTPVWTDYGYVVLRNQNIKNGKLDLSNPSFTDEAHFNGRNRRAKPSVGDIVITREAPMGDVCMIPEGLECCLGQRQVLLRPNPEVVSPRFILYALQSEFVQHQISWNEGTGSTVSNLRIPLLELLNVPTPPITEQRAIAHILGTLDDKIELNRKQNETLEAMARALFKAWFVDFEPVRAKMEGRWQHGQSLPGLPAHLFDLFPDKLVESELGEIPEGWHSYAFSDVAQQGKGTVNPGNSIQEAFTHYSLPAFDSAQTPIIELGETIKSNKTPVPDGAVLVSKLNPHIPRIWLVGEAGKNAVCSTEFIVWTPKGPANSAFLYCLSSSPEFNSAMRQLVTGTSNSHQRVKPEQLREIRVIAGCSQVIEEFSKAMRLPIEQVLQLRQQSQSLTQLRDTLLPKLISGELRVPTTMTENIT
jgi:type I restriction enzyme S subunit